MSDLPPNRAGRDPAAPVGPLDYGTPAEILPDGTPAAPKVGFNLRSFLLTAFAATIVLLILGGVVPRFAQVFKDFGTKLPAVTQLMLDASRLFLATPVWLTGPLLVIGIATSVAFIPLPRRAVRLLITLVMAVIVLFFALALLTPLLNLMDSLSNSAGGKH
jgi:type II secretory pathway component PulF